MKKSPPLLPTASDFKKLLSLKELTVDQHDQLRRQLQESGHLEIHTFHNGDTHRYTWDPKLPGWQQVI